MNETLKKTVAALREALKKQEALNTTFQATKDAVKGALS